MDGIELRVEEVSVGFELGTIEDLRLRLSRSRRAPDLGQGWERGAPSAWTAELVDDWYRFDIDPLQARLDALTHYRAQVGDQHVHVIRVEGSGPQPLPLLLTHGWPGSFLEYLKLIPLLSEPEAHSGDPADAFTLIIPSLPGFAFSGPPPHEGRTARDVARIWHRLMIDGFGYERYGAHGSDLGAGVTGWLARDHPDSLTGIHLATPGLAVPADRRSAGEERFAEAVGRWAVEEGGYMHEHATKPATLAAALADSPVGLAAWIGEKVVAWSSERADGFPRLTEIFCCPRSPCTGRPTRSRRPSCHTGPTSMATARCRPAIPPRYQPRSPSSVASAYRSPSRHVSSPSGSTTSPTGPSIRSGVTFQRWRSRRSSPT
jgi:pimeloyl-ACP methyl ester carboxylesterase